MKSTLRGAICPGANMEMYSKTMAGTYRFTHQIQFFNNRKGRPLRNQSKSWYDINKANLAVEIANFIITRKHFSVKDILILCAYSAQVAAVSDLMQKTAQRGLSRKCQVESVDSSQGDEADVIIVLFTRNTGRGSFIHIALPSHPPEES